MKTVFITGTSSGLGKEAAKLFQANGWKVIATMRDTSKGQDLAALENLRVLKMDINNTAEVEDAVNKAISTGAVDVVINNAAFGSMGPMEAYTDEQINSSVQTNFIGALKVTRAFLPHFRENKSGLFVNITSMAGILSFPFASLYIGVKHALEGWSEGLSYELKQFGIGVKTVAPGGIKSDFTKNSLIVTHDAYQEKFNHFKNLVSNPQTLENYTPAAEIAEMVYQATTDGTNTIHYVAGKDVEQMNNRRKEIGAEASVIEMEHIFLS